MLSYQRYFTLTTLLLFIVLGVVYFSSLSKSFSVDKQQVFFSKNSAIAKLTDKHLFLKDGDEPIILKLNFRKKPTAKENILEITETNIHNVSLITKEGKLLKLYNWLKCDPKENEDLSPNPYFQLSQLQLSSPIYLICPKNIYNPIAIKLYGLNHFFNKQANQRIINIILILIILLAFLIGFLVYLKIKNGYNILFSVYIFFSLLSQLLFNGFVNDFWPFNIHYFADHILCSLLALHVSIMCYFLILLIKKSLVPKALTILANCIFIFSLVTFFTTFILDSYLIFSYLIYLITIASSVFLWSYPSIFKRFKEKKAYKLNLVSVCLLTLVFFIHSLKHLNLLNSNLTIDMGLKMMYVGHIIIAFNAFILINKRKIIQIYLSKNQILLDKSFVKGIQNNSEILAKLSNREMEVLEYIAKGYTDKNLSEKLFVSVATIKTHKQRIYKKLSINNKVQATQIYVEFSSHQLNYINNSFTDS